MTTKKILSKKINNITTNRKKLIFSNNKDLDNKKLNIVLCNLKVYYSDVIYEIDKLSFFDYRWSLYKVAPSHDEDIMRFMERHSGKKKKRILWHNRLKTKGANH